MIMVCFAGAAAARADPPADRTVNLYMYEVPGDPDSGVAFSVALDLTAVDTDGNWVGWEITSIEIREYGTPDTVWIEDLPFVDTPDGLWWVEHEKPVSPQPADFTLLPAVEGTAIAQDLYDRDLEYAIAGSSYDPPPDGDPYPITAAVDYTFKLQGEEKPIREGNAEPAESPDELHETE
jgi:hypothetical protein